MGEVISVDPGSDEDEEVEARHMQSPDRIYTTDTPAMDRLTEALDAANVILTENNVLRREEHADRAANREKLEENTEAMRALTAAIDPLGIDLRELSREIVRGSKASG